VRRVCSSTSFFSIQIVGVLRAEKKNEPGHFSTLVPSRHDAGVFVDRCEIPAGRTRHVARLDQFLHSHNHVLVLFYVFAGAAVPEVFVVEEARDGDADGETKIRTFFSLKKSLSDTILHYFFPQLANTLPPV
jgi:hypothetical protein